MALRLNQFVYFLVIIACTAQLSSCSNDQVRNAAKDEALATSKNSHESAIGHASQTEMPIVGSIELSVKSSELTKGQEVCIPITAKGFKEVVSMQYTLQWDPSVLKFKTLRNFGLPGLSNQNYGTQLTDKGKLTHAWFDMNVKGITLSDNTPLYEVCFVAVGAPGAKSTIQFVEDPTIFEVSNVNSAFLELKQVPGVITIK